MSATRDKTQKVTFIFSNLHSVYKKGKEASVAAKPEQAIAENLAKPLAVGLTTSKVLKADDAHESSATSMWKHAKVSEYRAVELIGKRVEKVAEAAHRTELRDIRPKPEYLQPAREIQNHALDQLRGNLKTLNDLHSRLKFMLQELEDLVKE